MSSTHEDGEFTKELRREPVARNLKQQSLGALPNLFTIFEVCFRDLLASSNLEEALVGD